MDHEDYRWASYQVIKSKKAYEKSLRKAHEREKNALLIAHLEESIARANRVSQHLSSIADKLEAVEYEASNRDQRTGRVS